MISGVPVIEHRGNPDKHRPSVLVLDIGTSSVRAALFDEFGNEIPGTEARLVRDLCTTHDGGAELNADESVEQVARTVDAVIRKASSHSLVIEAVAVSCFWHSLVGLSSSRASAVTPVFGWADTRAARAVEELRLSFDEREVHARTGCRFHASYWPARLRWLQQERADLYRAVTRWMSFGEYLTNRFFGETEISISMASGTGLLDQRSGAWDGELLAWLGISAEQLPPVAGENKSFTGLTGEYARRWPQLSDARWFPAIGDGAANNIGAGCVTRERASLMVGTSGAMRVLWEDEAPAQPPPGLWRYRADRRRVVVGGALSDGGGLYGWMMDALAVGVNLEEIESALAEVEPDSHGLTVLPFWAGERSTGWSTRARGAILGLTMHTRAVEILRAAMESVAYRFALIAQELDTVAPGAAIVASGGALRASGVWTQIIADVLGRPLTLSGVRESSSRGAVLLALEAAGKIKSIAGVPAPPEVTYEPDMARHARYRAGLERHESIYQHLIADQEFASKVSEAAQDFERPDERRC